METSVSMAFAAGNMLCAAGFDLVLEGENPAALTAEKVAEKLKVYVESLRQPVPRSIPAWQVWRT